MDPRALPRRPRTRRGTAAPPVVAAAIALLAALIAGACGSEVRTLDPGGDRVSVVTTTELLADLVRRVGGARVEVVPLVAPGADPHSYEPSLRDVRNVVYAEVAFSNYLLLEQQSVVRSLDANLRDGAEHVALAEGATRYGAQVIPLVEDASLDTVWLGMRVHGDGLDDGATRSSDVVLRATDLEGPGDLVAYVTGSFGTPEIHIDSSNGFDREDSTTLPPDAHTHMSWAFTEPGVYRLGVAAELRRDDRSAPLALGQRTISFAVGVSPARVGEVTTPPLVVDRGHADLTVDLERRDLAIAWDRDGSGTDGQVMVDPGDAVIEVPNTALLEVPATHGLRSLGRPGDLIHQLPQAVLGNHVHGEIDPHLWHDVGNVIAYVELIRDTLIEVDPAAATHYRESTAHYVAELEQLDRDVRSTLSSIPEQRRHLVTTHDAFGYLAAAYDLEISGFVTPHPAGEPSIADRRRLTSTIENLDIPAVFLEPNLAARSTTLTEIAAEHGIRICPLLGDTFVPPITSYVEMMRANARSLRDCLG